MRRTDHRLGRRVGGTPVRDDAGDAELHRAQRRGLRCGRARGRSEGVAGARRLPRAVHGAGRPLGPRALGVAGEGDGMRVAGDVLRSGASRSATRGYGSGGLPGARLVPRGARAMGHGLDLDVFALYLTTQTFSLVSLT